MESYKEYFLYSYYDELNKCVAVFKEGTPKEITDIAYKQFDCDVIMYEKY